MKMSKIITAISCALIALSAAIIIPTTAARPINVPESNIPQQSMYTVGVYNGKLAVFEQSNDTPTDVYDVAIDDFPEADRILLAKGIPANSQAELQTILEDYTS